jgi:hypothetical protein
VVHRNKIVLVCWLAALSLLALPLAIRALVLFGTPASRLGDIADFIYDDGYYYLTIAANLADLGRSTMDGITATNGYQPLWLLVLTGLAKAVGTDAGTLFVSACVLIYALAWIAPLSALLWRSGTSRTLAFCMATGIATVIIQQPATFLEGLEPILIAPLAVVLIVLLELSDDPRASLLLSAVLAVAFLVRLDALSLYVSALVCRPVIQVLTGARWRDVARQVPGFTLRLSAFVIPTVAAYMAINQRLFGSAVPVSGRAKSTGGPMFSNWGVSHELFGHWKALLLLVAILALLEWLVRRVAARTAGTPEPLFYRAMAVVFLAVLTQYVYYAAFSTWHLWPWYEYLVALEIALVTARIVYLVSLLDWRQPASLIGLAALLCVLGRAGYRAVDFAYQSLPPATQLQFRFVEALGIKKDQAFGTISQEQVNLHMLDEFFDPRRNTLIAMGDRAGGLAYWGRGRVAVIQTEGLTMGVDYIKARAAGTGGDYLERLPIEYMVVDREVIPTTRAGPDGEPLFVIPDPIQGRVTTDPVPTFCFPSEAVRYNIRYPSGYASGTAYSRRIAFLFAQRVPCSPKALTWLRSIETGIGLRQFSLPSEYDSVPGGIYSKSKEDHDRHYDHSPAMQPE